MDYPLNAVMARTIMRLTGKFLTVHEVDTQLKALQKLLHPDKGGNHEEFVKLQPAHAVLRKAVDRNSQLIFHKYFCDGLCDLCVAMDGLLSSCKRCCKKNAKGTHTCGVFDDDVQSGAWHETKYTYVFRRVAHKTSLHAALFEFECHADPTLQVAAQEMQAAKQPGLLTKPLESNQELLDARRQSQKDTQMNSLDAGTSSAFQYGPLKRTLRCRQASTPLTAVQSDVDASTARFILSQGQAGYPSTCPLCESPTRLVYGPYGEFLGCSRYKTTRCRFSMTIFPGMIDAAFPVNAADQISDDA